MLTFSLFEYIHFFQLHFALIYFPETYRCCGAEIGDHHLGYFIWTDHANLKHKNAVPKSCCIRNRLNKLVSLRYWFLIFVLQVINITDANGIDNYSNMLLFFYQEWWKLRLWHFQNELKKTWWKRVHSEYRIENIFEWLYQHGQNNTGGNKDYIVRWHSLS